MRRCPTTPGQNSQPTLISGPNSDLVCTCSKISGRDPGNSRSLSTVPKKHLSWEPASLTTTISNFRLILHGSQVFPNSIGRISFTRPCPWHRGETVVNDCVCCFVLLNRYWGIVTVPGIHVTVLVGRTPLRLLSTYILVSCWPSLGDRIWHIEYGI